MSEKMGSYVNYRSDSQMTQKTEKEHGVGCHGLIKRHLSVVGDIAKSLFGRRKIAAVNESAAEDSVVSPTNRGWLGPSGPETNSEVLDSSRRLSLPITSAPAQASPAPSRKRGGHTASAKRSSSSSLIAERSASEGQNPQQPQSRRRSIDPVSRRRKRPPRAGGGVGGEAAAADGDSGVGWLVEGGAERGADTEGRLVWAERNCDICGPEKARAWCQSCQLAFCDGCWAQQAVHNVQRVRSSGLHEKTNISLMEIVSKLGRRRGHSGAGRRNRGDRGSVWLRAGVDQASSYVFLGITERLNNLTAGQPGALPSVIGFIGETGAGKSALIHALLLIKCGTFDRLEAPIVGSSEDLDSPVTRDVHLFVDPSTRSHPKTRIYADCEGLDCRSPLSHSTPGIAESHIELESPETKGTVSRQWIASKLYPGILYQKSDAIVYVMRNFRTVEVVLTNMIQWAYQVSNAGERSLKPCAILAVNASGEAHDTVGGQTLWGDGLAELILTKFANCIHQVPQLKQIVYSLRLHGTEIATLRQLFLYYFRDIKLICIPSFSSTPSLVVSQLCRLDAEIQLASDSSDPKTIPMVDTEGVRELGLLLTDPKVSALSRHD